MGTHISHGKRLASLEAYTAAKQQTRLEYARYIGDCRANGEKPKTFTNWLRDVDRRDWNNRALADKSQNNC